MEVRQKEVPVTLILSERGRETEEKARREKEQGQILGVNPGQAFPALYLPGASRYLGAVTKTAFLLETDG